MNGLITNPFAEGVILLIAGAALVVVSHLVSAPELQPVGTMVLGGGVMQLGLAKVNQGEK